MTAVDRGRGIETDGGEDRRTSAELTDDLEVLPPELAVRGDVPAVVVDALETAIDANPNAVVDPVVHADTDDGRRIAYFTASYEELPHSGPDGEVLGWKAPYQAREDVHATLREALPDAVDHEFKNNHTTEFYPDPYADDVDDVLDDVDRGRGIETDGGEDQDHRLETAEVRDHLEEHVAGRQGVESVTKKWKPSWDWSVVLFTVEDLEPLADLGLEVEGIGAASDAVQGAGGDTYAGVVLQLVEADVATDGGREPPADDRCGVDLGDVPGRFSATGVDDPVPDAEYGDSREDVQEIRRNAVGDGGDREGTVWVVEKRTAEDGDVVKTGEYGNREDAETVADAINSTAGYWATVVERDRDDLATDGGEDLPDPAELADPDCIRCGGTGQVVEMVMGRSGMVPCPSCRREDRLDAGE